MNFDTSGGEIFRGLYVDNERYNIQVGLGGVKFLLPDGRTYRTYPLNQIARWSLHSPFLTLFVKTPSDPDERPMNIQGEERVVRSMLDTLTSCCMQMMELLESQKEPETSSAAPSSRRAPEAAKRDPSDVSFWSHPEKAGWLQSQGDHLKTWRRRWFVLKGGFLFRFMDPKDVNPSAKPRGVINLNRATDIGDARKDTGKPNSIRVVVENQPNLFIADSETETVEWLSALEGAMHAAVKATAGVQEAKAPAPAPSRPDPSSDLLRTLESSYRALERSAPPKSSAPALPAYQSAPPPLQAPYQATQSLYRVPMPAGVVQVTGYDGPSGGSGGYGSAHGFGGGGEDFGLSAGHIGGLRPAHEAPQPMMAYGGGAGTVPQAAPVQAYQYAAPVAPQAPVMPQQIPTPQPTAQVQPGAPAAPPATWQMFYTPEGKPYYYNAQTGGTQWEPPSSFL